MIDCDILIAGSGIAGLTAALTAVRVGRSTMVLTGATLGGQLLSINKIDGYPGFPDGVPGYDPLPHRARAGDGRGRTRTPALELGQHPKLPQPDSQCATSAVVSPRDYGVA